MKKVTLFHLTLGIVYGITCFFILGVILRFGITYFYTKNFNVSSDDIFKTFLMSSIAGIGASLGSWAFTKIDEYKARKSPPSDPKP